MALPLTENGYKNIEDVEVGDKVIATDQETGETAVKEVKRTFENKTFELLHLTVNGEVITSTPGHKYYAPEKGWTAAIELRAGDLLQLVNGEYVVVEAVQHEILETPVTIYNFEVEDFHTYYVGEQSVLVHNNGCGPDEIIDITVDSKGNLTNGRYTINPDKMAKHTNGTPGKSQFLYDVDADKATLDAAAYADEFDLWEASSGNPEDFADKAKVYVENGPVGVTGSGELTDYINVYRTKTGQVHGCPGNPRR